MTKIISAQSILKQKGFVQNKFDANGFMRVVGEYFLANEVESKLLLLPFRFLDIKVDKENDPCEIISREDLPRLTHGDESVLSMMEMEGTDYSVGNPFEIGWRERLLGYKSQTEVDKATGEPAYTRKIFENDFESYRKQQDAGILVPRVIIDKPFFENAAATLRIMGGYVVEKQSRKGKKLYWVTLI